MPTIIVNPKLKESTDDQSRHLWGLVAHPDIDAKGMHLDGRIVPLVIDVQLGHMNLTGRMARNIRYADDSVLCRCCASTPYCRAVSHPRSEGELQRIIKAQRDRIHHYPYLSTELKLVDWSDAQWHVDVSHHPMNKYNMTRLSSSSTPRGRSWIGPSSKLSGYMTRGRCPSPVTRKKSCAASKR